ncbi:hypothetical protein EPN96_08650 [bacterium]|nr:MAG: hypothetical protein EPN96_08650 [bacterium]
MRFQNMTRPHEETQETHALLRILALGNRQIEEGRVRPFEEVIKGIRERRVKGGRFGAKTYI